MTLPAVERALPTLARTGLPAGARPAAGPGGVPFDVGVGVPRVGPCRPWSGAEAAL